MTGQRLFVATLALGLAAGCGLLRPVGLVRHEPPGIAVARTFPSRVNRVSDAFMSSLYPEVGDVHFHPVIDPARSMIHAGPEGKLTAILSNGSVPPGWARVDDMTFRSFEIWGTTMTGRPIRIFLREGRSSEETDATISVDEADESLGNFLLDRVEDKLARPETSRLTPAERHVFEILTGLPFLERPSTAEEPK